MKRTAHLPTSVWPRQHTTAPDQALAFVLAIPFEFTRAIAAAHRYEELRLKPSAYHSPDAYPARRIYLEFYADR